MSQESSTEFIANLKEAKPGLNKCRFQTVFYGIQDMILEKDIAVVMRDGVKLYLNVCRPDKPGRFPVIMSADVYGKDAPADDHYAWIASRGGRIGVVVTSGFTSWESPDPGSWVPNDYAVVKLNLRGSYNSEGALYPLSPTEAQDYAEVVEWAGTQEWSNGNVGTCGVSYLAMSQWYMAALNPPHLKAAMPWEGVNDMYRDWTFHGGIPETNFTVGWATNTVRKWKDRETEDMLAMRQEHPFFDDYWESRRAKLKQIKVPLYVGASWSTQGTHNRGSLEGFKQASSQYKWLEVHGRREWEYFYTRETLERQLRFFNYFLKGAENDWLETPRVRLEVRERFFEGQFRFENEFPIARTKYTRLYMHGGAKILTPTPSRVEARLPYEVGPEVEKGSLKFSYTFMTDTELTGNMKLKIYVQADGSDDMDLHIGIKKYDKRGNEVYFADFSNIENGQVASGWLRVSHRELDPERSTPQQPWLKHQRLLKLKEGEIVPVEIEILASSTIFRAGETLGLIIQGHDIIFTPRRHQHLDTVNKGKHIIYTGGQYDSHLLVPVIPPKC